MYRLKTKATEEEAADIKERLIAIQNTPVIALSSDQALRGGMPGDMTNRLRQEIHTLAISKGLPETSGFYGLDLKTREFLSQEPVEETDETL